MVVQQHKFLQYFALQLCRAIAWAFSGIHIYGLMKISQTRYEIKLGQANGHFKRAIENNHFK